MGMKMGSDVGLALLQLLIPGILWAVEPPKNSLPWPHQSLQEAGVDPVKWSHFLKYAFSDQEGFTTDALFVLYKGKVIHHSTANGFQKGQVHRQWSVSKSVLSLLVGKAVEQGLVKLSEPITNYYSIELNSHPSPTIQNLLEMSSGLHWKEGYASNPFASKVIAMLYTDGTKDMALFASSQTMEETPGKNFVYSSGDSNILSGILKKKMSVEVYNQYPWKTLFEPLGISSATWEKDGAGSFVGSSYLYMPPEDLAKIGFLVLHKGQYFGKQILEKGWFDDLAKLPSYFSNLKGVVGEKYETYGGHWWLNRDLPGFKNSRSFETLPENALMAQGYQGQLMLILPDQELVLVRNSTDVAGKLNKNRFFELLMAALP